MKGRDARGHNRESVKQRKEKRRRCKMISFSIAKSGPSQLCNCRISVVIVVIVLLFI